MVTKEKIAEEIHELMEQPLCQRNIELLADLMYIHRHMDGCDRPKEWGWGNKWVESMNNADGSHGAHWTMEQVSEVAKRRNFQGNPWLLWIAMNAEWSDRSVVNVHHNVVGVDYYYDSAVAFWLEDKDAVEDKLWAYYKNVVKC